jgi:hypothetical protein
MKILSEAQMMADGWVKTGDNLWHSPVRRLPEEIVEARQLAGTVEERVRSRPPLRCKTIAESHAEADQWSRRTRLVEAFMGTGMDRKTAERAADIR